MNARVGSEELEEDTGSCCCCCALPVSKETEEAVDGELGDDEDEGGSKRLAAEPLALLLLLDLGMITPTVSRIRAREIVSGFRFLLPVISRSLSLEVVSMPKLAALPEAEAEPEPEAEALILDRLELLEDEITLRPLLLLLSSSSFGEPEPEVGSGLFS